MTFSFCNEQQFTCKYGDCIDMTKRCDGKTDCDDGSDEYECSIIVPSLNGNNKLLIPRPLPNQNFLYINYTYRIEKILLIDENENFMRIKYRTVKEWYNSYLTFQNLKYYSKNLLGPDEKDLMWMPWIIFMNIESVDKCKRTDDPEILEVVTTHNFDFTLNSLTEPQNAHLFKVESICED